MAKKKSQLERAIESLEADKAVLESAISRLRQELAKQPKKRQKADARPALGIARGESA